MATSFLVVKNRAFSKLAAALTDSALTVDVTAGDGALFPSTYPFHITIDDEILAVTNRSTDTLTFTRAAQGSSAAAHSSGGRVFLNITAKSITDLNTAVNAIEDIRVDDAVFEFGTDADVGMVLRSSILGANTPLAGIAVGTPVAQAVAADSFLIGNVTASGDIAMYVNKGGASQQVFWADGSSGDTAIMAASGQSVDVYVGGAKVLDITNDGTVTTLAGLAGDYFRIGDAATTQHTLNSEDDLMVSGDFEVTGTTFLDGILDISPAAAADYHLRIAGTDILNSGEQAIYINTPLETIAANGIWITLGSRVSSGDLTGIRSRVTGNATSAGANVRGGYFEATMAAVSKYAAMLEGALFHADYSAGSVTVSGDVRGFTAHISQGTGLNAANLYGGLINIQTRGNETITSDDVGLMIRNEAVGGTGRQMDAAIKIAEASMGGGTKGFGYGIDLTGATYGTADVRLTSGGKIVSAGAIYIIPNGDVDDYLSIETLSNVPTLKGVGAYLRVGDAATTSHGLASEDDLMVSGKLEVAGSAFFDLGISVTGGSISTSSNIAQSNDNAQHSWGANNEVRMNYAVQDADAKIAQITIDESDDSGNNVPVLLFAEETNYSFMDLGLFDEVVQPHIAVGENEGKYTSSTTGTADGADNDELTETNKFTNSVVGDVVRIISGTNVTAGWYRITAVTDASNVDLDRDFASGASTDITYVAYHGLGMITPRAFYLPIYDGAPSDSDIDINLDGAIALDVGNNLLYGRSGTVWQHWTPDGESPSFADLTLTGDLLMADTKGILTGESASDYYHLDAYNTNDAARIEAVRISNSAVASGLAIMEVTADFYLVEKAAAGPDIAARGQHWVKTVTPNEPWFTDDEGNDIFIGQGDFAGIAVDNNSGALTPEQQHGWELITVFDADCPENISNGDHTNNNITVGATGVYRLDFDSSAAGGGANKTYKAVVFELTETTGPIASTTNATPVVVTDVGHPFSTNDKIKITGVATATDLNDRIFLVTKLTADTYSLQEDNGGDIIGTAIGSGGTARLVNELELIHAHRKFAAADVGPFIGWGTANLTKDRTVELYYKNITDTTDILFETIVFGIQRLG